ncbi:MAG: D-aminoacyl-tRNA deacylase [Methanomassiliicoccales archaeon]
MRLLLSSSTDVASLGIRDALLARSGWQTIAQFHGSPVFRRGEDILATSSSNHLFHDEIDKEFEMNINQNIDELVFLSRHKAVSEIPTLTVHAIGNFGNADYGGREGVLVESMPDAMTSALRQLVSSAKGLEFQVSFEVTHHGPYISKPAMFIEIGSSERQWSNKEAAEAIARTLLETRTLSSPKVIGIGGGHYAPRFTELALAKKVSFGHMIPNHFVDICDDNSLRRAIELALERTERANLVYIHKKSMSRARATHIKRMVKEMGVEVVDSSYFDEL